ncbi:hypothetical protein LEMLEM_LOCUS7597 [Lemmus lemmus]
MEVHTIMPTIRQEKLPYPNPTNANLTLNKIRWRKMWTCLMINEKKKIVCTFIAAP